MSTAQTSLYPLARPQLSATSSGIPARESPSTTLQHNGTDRCALLWERLSANHLNHRCADFSPNPLPQLSSLRLAMPEPLAKWIWSCRTHSSCYTVLPEFGLSSGGQPPKKQDCA